MPSREFKDRIKGSRAAPVAALPLRGRLVGRHVGRQVKEAARWIVRSREHENFTYDLTPRNLEHLAWFVSAVAPCTVTEARGYIAEIEGDAQLRRHAQARARSGPQSGLSDLSIRYGRRVGWYAMVRATRPNVVVETGTDKGLGTLVLAAAVRRNGVGRVVTVDVDTAAGHLIAEPYGEFIDQRIGDSLDLLTGFGEPVDLFLHDSLHTPEHEAAEFAAVAPLLSPDALVLSDNAHVTSELASWAEATGRRFLFFDERPAGHWYPGAGIGVAVSS
ncbi:class I SAM-dependent methyltransferase [Aeromicrobium duanguangcaii]|uniref:class I SAM-dependent methyltransferase n=1 Tax=Aeromicrobium duanguangcaii TaxID=2968086 RepID=UPI002017CA5E|nr:class I SAM-dependent methyltransferase [Aeromicrobium duanguangcaii]MCL3838276.1 class I SAM-dependent methyltransferase [Aeromicrobium duanguangcaii]